MSIEIDNPKNYIFTIFKFKPTFEENELRFFYDVNEIQKKEFEYENKESFKIKVYYIQRIPSYRKFNIKYKTITHEFDNNVNFIYNISLLSYSQLELSDYEKFKCFHNFVDNINSDSLKELLYSNTILNLGNKNSDLQIAMELIDHYKNDKKNIEIIISMITSVNKYIVDIHQLNESKEKWLQLIEGFDKNEIFSEENLFNKGKLIIMIFIYIILDFDKFIKFYDKNKSDKNKKKEIYRIIGLNKTIEHIFTTEKITKDFANNKNVENMKKMILKINYFENLLFLLDFLLKNITKKNIQIEIKDNYQVSNDDNFETILNSYEDIIQILPNFGKDKKIQNIWNNYINEFEKEKNIKKLIFLKYILPTSEILKTSISKCIQTTFESLSFSNKDIIDYINKNITSNINLIKGELEIINIFPKFDYEKIDDNFINEFKKMKLKDIMGARAFYSSQAIPIINTNNLKQLEKIMKIMDFSFDLKNSNELFYFQNFLIAINETIERILNDYNDIEFDSLVNIIIILSSNKVNIEIFKKLIEILYNKLPKKVQIKLFIILINKDNISDKEIHESIINYLRILCIENNQIEETLENIQNLNYLNSILENYEIPKEDDFFLNEEKKNLKLLKTFIDRGVLENSNFINDGYGNKIILLLNELKTKIVQKHIQLKLGEEMLR